MRMMSRHLELGYLKAVLSTIGWETIRLESNSKNSLEGSQMITACQFVLLKTCFSLPKVDQF